MNQTDGVLGATIRGAGWGLPWLSVLVISASVAYATTVAIAGAAAHAPAQALVAVRPAESGTSLSALDRRGSEVCDTTGGRILYVGFNSWIPAETGATRCPDGIP
jgi:hypothetical protein